MTLPLRIVSAEFYLRDIVTRLPFRFGAATVTNFPLLHLALTVETTAGPAIGFAADNLMPRWFDKDPGKTAEQNIADLLRSAEIAAAVYGEAGRQPSLFALWQAAYPECRRRAGAAGLNALTGAFGSALFERAAIDALGRAHSLPLRQMLAANVLGLRPDAVHPETRAEHLRSWTTRPAPASLALRHTVGMLDPLVEAECDADTAVDDLPRSLAAYVRRQGLRYFKLKLSGDIVQDIARLQAVAAVLDRLIAAPYAATLDGNEQYPDTDSVLALLAAMAEAPDLARLRRSLLFLEQPLARANALDPAAAAGLKAIGARLPVIIDESDDDPLSFATALDLGYAGVSSKNCKGVIKSFLNRTLVAARQAQEAAAFMSAEDLTNLPIVPLQQDLLTVSCLGITHVERNGHHYVRGLDHCSGVERTAALVRHGDLYREVAGGAELAVRDGRLVTGSLEVPGYGVGFAPDLPSMTPLADWRRRLPAATAARPV